MLPETKRLPKEESNQNWQKSLLEIISIERNE
jgi:hypothetical protein